MNLITGRAGVAHITPRQDAMWHQGLIETESCIFDAYENFAAEIITNNEVRIRSGVGMLQGRFFCIEPNTYDSADIANGNQEEYRKDLIVARITVDASTNTQSASIEVIQGTPAAENPTAPEAIVGDLDAGDLIADYPLVEVLLNGINIESLTPVFDTGWLFNAEGRQKLNFIGTNPITSGTANDTPANWKALGTGIAKIGTSGTINDKPTSYGVIINNVVDGNVTQLWQGITSNGMWFRLGDDNGWIGTWRKVLDETNGIQIKELWENASPTSDFASQTINLDFSEYNAIEIDAGMLKSSSYRKVFKVNKPLSGDIINALLDFSFGTANKIVDYYRTITINYEAGTILFGAAYTANPSSDSTTASAVIPLKIYGIKGVE